MLPDTREGRFKRAFLEWYWTTQFDFTAGRFNINLQYRDFARWPGFPEEIDRDEEFTLSKLLMPLARCLRGCCGGCLRGLRLVCNMRNGHAALHEE